MTLGTNTITVTIDTVEKTLTRINQDNFSSIYYLHEATQEFTVNIRHTQEALQSDGTRFDRHNVEIIQNVFPTESVPGQTRVAYSVFRNKRGDSYTAVAATFVSLSDFLSDEVIDDLLAWKS